MTITPPITPITAIGIYCSASKNIDPAYMALAEATGALVAAKGYTLVYGGGRRGLMGTVSKSAMAAGGYVVGYIPHHLVAGEEANEAIQELHVVDDMHVRKMSMFTRSDAFLILPGGFGTLEEFFEIFVWKQIRLHSKPIVVLNYNGFWDPLKDLMTKMVTDGFAKPFIWDLCTFVTTLEEVPAALEEQAAKQLPDHKWQ